MSFSDRIKTASDGRKYIVVVKNDSLWTIAENYYGDGTKYKQLAAINDIDNADLIYIGQTIYFSKAGSSGGASSTSSDTQKVTIKQFGLQADIDNVLFATWAWDKNNTAEYQVDWDYYTNNKTWFHGEDSTTDKKQCTYSIPSNATQVRVRIKPISKTKKEGDKDVYYWKAEWTSWEKHTVTYVPKAPSNLEVSLEGFTLTATVSNLEDDPSIIKFEVVKDNVTVYKTGKAAVATATASYSCKVEAGGEYKVRCCAYKDGQWGDWSAYSSNFGTIPSAPSKFTKCEPKAKSDTPTICLEWSSVATAKTYDIQYTTKKSNFDVSDQVTTVSGIETNSREISSGIENGSEYFFRVRAINDKGESGWSEISSTVIGTGPAAPTTWSSTTTVVSGDPLTLYWVHNSEDNSSQTFAHLEIYVNGVLDFEEHIENTASEEDKDKTSSYFVKMVNDDGAPVYPEGAKIQWRVRTAGITNVYGDWSILRSVDVYAQPTLELSITNSDGTAIGDSEPLKSLPLKVSAIASPNTQAPIGYYITITANEPYETVDDVGNIKSINAGDQVYSKHFDIVEALSVDITASDLSLENGIEYTLTCTVSMNSGLTADNSVDFTVSWSKMEFMPNAEIGIDEDTYSAYIKPYCASYKTSYHKVSRQTNAYVVMSDTVDGVYGSEVQGAYTTTGEQVMQGTTADGDEIYYCVITEMSKVSDVLLAVYRREPDGSFTELISDLDGTKESFITDPHPALDYARYRIVATAKETGAVVYSDLPGHPIGEKAVIIQWDEEWTNFDTFGNEDALEKPAWSGSLLRLPYNVDISNKHSSDVALIEYIGRKHPVSYYGTQLGETATWNVSIDKNDKETLYGLRRLAVWPGDVYVREPSGTGYWANVNISFNLKHREMAVPVTIDITRVEGGV